MKHLKTYFLCFSILALNNYTIAQTVITVYTPNGSPIKATVDKELPLDELIYEMDQNYYYWYEHSSYDITQTEIVSCATHTYNCNGFAWIVSEGGLVCDLEWDFSAFWKDGSYVQTDKEHAEKILYGEGGHSAVKSNFAGKYIEKLGDGPLIRRPSNSSPFDAGYDEKQKTYYRLKCPSVVENQHYTTNDVNISTRCDTLKIKNTTIEAGANVSVTSNKVIRLLPGFHAKAGSSFHAKIEKFTFDVDNPVLPIEIDWSPCEKYSITPPAAPKIKSVVNNNNNNNNTENDDAENATKASAPNTVILYVPSDPLVSTKYYNLQGIEIHKPLGNSIYIEKQTYQSGKIETRKVFRH